MTHKIEIPGEFMTDKLFTRENLNEWRLCVFRGLLDPSVLRDTDLYDDVLQKVNTPVIMALFRDD